MRKTRRITALSVEPGRPPCTIRVGLGFIPIKEFMGGYFEPLYLFDDPVALLVDEEGSLKGLPVNRIVYGKNGEKLRILGKFLVVGVGSYDFCSLGSDMISKYTELFSLDAQV